MVQFLAFVVMAVLVGGAIAVFAIGLLCLLVSLISWAWSTFTS